MVKKMRRLFMGLALALLLVGAKQTVMAENVIKVDSTTFPDKVLREKVMEKWENMCNMDSTLRKDEYKEDEIDADAIGEITIYRDKNTSVSSLKGIELLTNLSYLHIGEYTGTTLDLSKNTNLSNIYINSTKYTLKPKNFAKISKLTNLTVGGKTGKTFDISSLKNLNYFMIFNSQITSMDVSKNSKLNGLWIINNKSLTKLVLGKSNNLRSVSIENSKKLISLDVSKLSKLSALSVIETGIRKINTSNNKELFELNISGNKNITSVDIRKNTKLGYINVGATSITKLDVSKQGKLISLAAYNTKLSSLNISKNKKLKNISIANTAIKSLNLSQQKNITGVEINGTKIKSLDLSKYKGLESVSCDVGQKIKYPSKVTSAYIGVTIAKVKKGSNITLPSFCKGMKFKSAKDYKLTYKNGKVYTSKSTKKSIAYGTFLNDKRFVFLSIMYK